MIGIRNIVFDLGGVLMTWDPVLLVDRVFSYLSPQDRPYQVALITKHPAWAQLDRGIINTQQAIHIFSEQLVGPDKPIHNATVQQVTDYVLNMQKHILQLPPGIQILHTLRALGYKTYVLSNYNQEYFQYIIQRYDWFNGFDGITVSFECHFNKPEKGIYETLLRQHNLVPSECLFIDDKPDNVDAAKALGMMGVVCDNHKNVADYLKSSGVVSDKMESHSRFGINIGNFITGEYKTHRSWLDDQEYGLCLDNMVKACVDIFLIHAETDSVLLGKRNYHPQKDWWVACGGRMFPGETPQLTLDRLFKRELGIDLDSACDSKDSFSAEGILSIDYVGAYTHIWGKRRQAPEDNGTCDVVLLYAVIASQSVFDQIKLDKEEYSDSKFVPLIDLIEDHQGGTFHPALSCIARDIRKIRTLKRLQALKGRSESERCDKLLSKETLTYLSYFQ